VSPAAAAAGGHHHAAMMGGVQTLGASTAGAAAIGVTAPLLHTLGYLLVTVVLAVVVYEKVGLRVLRRAWINVNVVWAAALVVAAVASVLG
jgi:hypothetical protein